MKGVSPVIATVLMVAVAIAAAVVFYSWIMSTTASTTTQASAQAGTIGKYSLVIESAKCSSTDTNAMEFYIRNQSDVSIDDNFTYIIQDASGKTVCTDKVELNLPAHTVVDASIPHSSCTNISGEKDQRVTLILKGPGGIAVSTDQPITCT